ncbi:uncharacterized protein CMU_005740 [Cryptosporidium muris RN66]|uniref:Amino acid transporter transmembrane domain-containing protein n=1 Tax=Cryptosporidium muris (strain RN66) TaxID=441375 RepID=B6AHF6_CRYMR|nr:uncharacterized protein CMU_005740 [Cryptosporidium muris RN66]EEA07651.1 hypothetical protein, conserved [Cryptosporidium muris RN66]|eukprot:XP_002142000.1 hypothetical protein [Cryptosporidium muris RN66]
MGVLEVSNISLPVGFALICSACIGSGVLVLSYGVMQAGLVLGIFFMICAAIVGCLTESIYIATAFKLKVFDLSSLIAGGVTYTVIREKRQSMKKKKIARKYIDNHRKFHDIEQDSFNSTYYKPKLNSTNLENEDIRPNWDEVNVNSRLLKQNWTDISDIDSGMSDIECVRNVLTENTLLCSNFKSELKSRIMRHSKILNCLIIVLITYCIPIYFILFGDYVENLLAQAIHILKIHYPDFSLSWYLITVMNYLQNRSVIYGLCFLFSIYPSCQKDVSKLANLGWLSVTSFFVFLLAVSYRYFISPFTGPLQSESKPYVLGPHMGFLSALKVLNYAIYCFYAHLICVQTITSLRNPTIKRGIHVIIASGIFILSICISISLMTNFTFGTALLPNPTLNYSPYDSIMALARLLSALTMLTVIPLHVVPMIDSFINLCYLDIYAEKLMSDIEEAMLLVDNETLTRKLSQQSVSSYFTVVGEGRVTRSSFGGSICATERSEIPKTEKFLKSYSFRVIAAIIFLLICITLAFYAKSAAQYIELFAGFFDTVIILLYPLYLYWNVWRHKMSMFVNVVIIGYIALYEVGAVTAGVYCVYQHFFS